jgi:hypothetical protein
MWYLSFAQGGRADWDAYPDVLPSEHDQGNTI